MRLGVQRPTLPIHVLTLLFLTSRAAGTSLIGAARDGDVKKVKELIREGASVDKGDDGDTPLTVAAHYGHAEVAQVLLKGGASVDKEDGDGFTPLSMAALYGHAEVAQVLLKGNACVDKVVSGKGGYTPLSMAAQYGHLEVAQVLLNGGATVDKLDGNSWTPLTAAAETSESGHLEVAQVLLKAGASVNKVDGNGLTPLTSAAHYGHAEVAQVLLKEGASVEKVDGNGWTPLMHAAHGGDMDSVTALLEAGAEVLPRDAGSHTAQMLAALKGHQDVAKYLKDKAPHGMDLLRYYLSRRQAWLSVAAGLFGAMAVHTVTARLAHSSTGHRYSALAGTLVQTEAAKPSAERLPPRGAMLLAAKKVRHSGSTLAKMGRTVQVLCNVLAPFGGYMLILQPPLVFAAYAFCYVLPAWWRHGTRPLVEKPVLVVSAASPAIGLLRSLAWAAVLLYIKIEFPHQLTGYFVDYSDWSSQQGEYRKKSVATRIDELTFFGNPTGLSLLNPAVWNNKMWEFINYYFFMQGLAVVSFVLGSVLLLMKSCCEEQQRERAAKEEKEVEDLARKIERAAANGKALEDLGVKRLARWLPLSSGVIPTGVDSVLALAVVDCLVSDTNTIILLLKSENYKFAAVLMTVVNASLFRVLGSSGLRKVWEERNESLRLGYFTDALHELIDSERGFEAFFSLALTSYSLLFCVTTPVELLIQTASMLLSAWGLAGVLHECEDLGVV